MKIEMQDMRTFFLTILGIGCIIALIGTIYSEYTKIGIVIIALSSLAIRIQEEKVYRKNNFVLWSEMKAEAAEFYFKQGIAMIIWVTITGTIFTMVGASSLCLVIIAMEKTLQKELLIRTPCKTASKFMKKFKFSSNKYIEVMKYKNCSRVET